MGILHRYLLASVLTASLGGMAIFAFLMLAGNLLQDLSDRLASGQVLAGLALDVALALLPYALSFSLPLGMLVGTLMVMGRLSANHELTAMRAAGWSLWMILAPVFALLVVAAGAATYVNAAYAPSARAQYKRLIHTVVREDPIRLIEPQRFIHEFPGYVIYAGARDGDRLRNFWIWELDPEGRQALRLLRAETGQLRYEPQDESLVLALEGSFVELRDTRDPDNLRKPQPMLSIGSLDLRLPVGEILGATIEEPKMSELSLGDLRQRREALPVTDEVERGQLSYFMHRNLAMGVSVLALGLLGLPLGIRVSRKETFTNIAVAVALGVGYYFAIALVGMLEKQPHLRPDLLVWLPNLACLAVGLLLIHRVERAR